MDLIRFTFACFGIFANTSNSHHLLHISFKMFAQIRIQIFDLMQKNTCCSKYSLNIFSYRRIFAKNCFKLFSKAFHKTLVWLNIRFFLKIFAKKGIFASAIRFACKICRFASMRNKRIKPVLFASKRINIRFIFAYICLEPNLAAHPNRIGLLTLFEKAKQYSLPKQEKIPAYLMSPPFPLPFTMSHVLFSPAPTLGG